MAANPTKSDDYPTVIGADASFKGELTFQGSVRIDGQFEGGIRTEGTVLVCQGGRVKAEVHAGSVTIDGTVEGNVAASSRIQLNASCKLKGDVRAAKLTVSEGATWSGRCDVGPGAAKTAAQGASQPEGALRQISEAASGKK